MRTMLLTGLVFLLAAGLAPGREEPLVRVGDSVVTRADLQDFMRLRGAPRMPPAGGSTTPLQYDQIEAERKREALRELVERELLVQAARKRYIREDYDRQTLDAFAEEQFEKLCSRLGSKVQARRYLFERGLTVERFKELQTETLLAARLLQVEVYADVHAAPAELRSYYRAHRQDFRVPGKVVYRQILFTVPAEEQADSVRQEAESVLKKIHRGADFAEMADRYSADRDKYPGGLHEVKLPEDRPDWRPQAVRDLQEGEISNVRRSPGGFVITRFERVVPPHTLSFREAQPTIQRLLSARKKQEAEAEYLQRLESRSFIKYFPAAREIGL